MQRAITNRQIRSLMEHHGKRSVSIFLPTHVGGTEAQQDPIRFRNLVDQAQQQMETSGMRPAAARKKLQPLRDMIEDGHLWRNQHGAMAVFVGQGDPLVFCVSDKFEPLVVVSDRFHVKPLIPISEGELVFYVLAVSQRSVRLFKGTRGSMIETELPKGTPKKFEDLGRYIDGERHVDFHTETAGHGVGGDRPAVFHGQGEGTDQTVEKRHVLEYCQLVERGVGRALQGQNAPLVLAAVDSLANIYREANQYQNLMSRIIPGNPDRLSIEDLHPKALEIVAPVFDERRTMDANRYKSVIGTGKASNDIREILGAAHTDRVETAFVARDEHQWGRYVSQQHEAEMHEQQLPGDEDLLDLAAVRSRLSGGTVYIVDRDQIPDDSPAVAMFRF